MEYKTSKAETFDSIYRAYKDEIYRISLHFTKDEYMAQEITQKTFFQFYLHMDGANINKVRSYLIRTAKNLIYNCTRDTKYEQSEGELEVLEEKSDTTMSVEHAYLLKEQRKRQQELSESILERLRQENELWYEAVNLVCCLEKPQDIVAAELGITKDVLYSRLHRARRWIQKNYSKEFEEIMRLS